MTEDADRNDAVSLERFVSAQSGAYQCACDELRAGRKRSHWIWYVFPQMKGLGFSQASHRLRHQVPLPKRVHTWRIMFSGRASSRRLASCWRYADVPCATSWVRPTT